MNKILEFIRNQYTYAKYVFYHKWRVMVWGYYLSKPIGFDSISFMWQCALHDMSKFYPEEWLPYAAYFGGKVKLKIDYQDKGFNLAWSKHLARNPHHWQYWTRVGEHGLVAKEMPSHYVYEMVSDWKSAGEAQSNPTNLRDWYKQNGCMMTLHENTKRLIESLIERIMVICG